MERDMIVFFYKKKTAYEVRISDWSSDVCSSDLRAQLVTHVGEELGLGAVGGLRLVASGRQLQAAACLFLLQAMVLDRLFLEHLDRARHVAHLVGAREIRHRGSRIASGNAAHGADAGGDGACDEEDPDVPGPGESGEGAGKGRGRPDRKSAAEGKRVAVRVD